MGHAVETPLHAPLSTGSKKHRPPPFHRPGGKGALREICHLSPRRQYGRIQLIANTSLLGRGQVVRQRTLNPQPQQ